MEALTIALRAIHFTAVIVLFGEFAFHFFVTRPVLRAGAELVRDERLALRRRLFRMAAWSLAAAFISGIGWLVLQASAMSGMPVERALDRQTLGEVLNATLFGRVMEVRFGLAVALGTTLVLSCRTANERSATILEACASLVAGAFLATLAWAGHAAADQGGDRLVHLSSDAAHLLAAGAWLGALPPLIFALGLARRGGAGTLEFAARVTRRFSYLGMASVGTLVLTGVVNSWYTVETLPALFGTGYGRLLLVKLALFGAMVSLAAFNRLRLSPRLSSSVDRSDGGSMAQALGQLQRNAIAETALGIAVVGIVGALGITVPALHVQPVWPFSFTLDWENAEASGGAFAVGAAAAAGLACVLLGAIARKRAMLTAGAVGLLAALLICVRLLAVSAHPTTYFRSPVRYAADSISRGVSLYTQHCTTCHGPLGYGDGPAAASLATKPANLTKHYSHHSEGDLLWFLQHGIAGTTMPPFGNLGDERLWDLINFLHAQAESEGMVKKTDDSIEPERLAVAPDFTFQIGRRPQETLAQQREVVLLVFYRLPGSLARLRALSEAKSLLRQAGARIVAIPMTGPPAGSRTAPGVDTSILADPDPRIAAAYAMFRRTAFAGRAPPAAEHVEFLVDRQGYLRGSWAPAGWRAWDRIPTLTLQISLLEQKKYRSTVSRIHVH
jgi:putative copper resistance protein D